MDLKPIFNGNIKYIPYVILIKRVCYFEFRIYNFLLLIFNVVVYKLVNRLVRIQNEPRDFYSNCFNGIMKTSLLVTDLLCVYLMLLLGNSYTNECKCKCTWTPTGIIGNRIE